MIYENIQKSASLCARKGFSLTELLIAMLVASLLIAAMVPVMTKKSRETLAIKGRNNYAVLAYGDINCPAASNQDLDNGNASCSGNFLVPDGVTELTVTVVGAGGGGGAGNASGYAEYTTPGTSSFTVPYGSTDINATLISGGAGGGAGGVVTTYWEKLASNSDSTQDWTWTIPNQVKSKNVIIEACAGGGGGGGQGGCSTCYSPLYGGGGGAGEYVKKMVSIGNSDSTLYVRLGGGGSPGARGQGCGLYYGPGGLCGGGGGEAYWGSNNSGAAGVLNTRMGCGGLPGAVGGSAAGGGGGIGGSAPQSGGTGGTYCGGGGGTGPSLSGDNDGGTGRLPGGGGGGGASTVVALNSAFSSPLLHLVGGGGGSSGSVGNTDISTFNYTILVGGGGGGGGGPATGNKGRGGSILAANDFWGRRGYSGDGSGGDGGNGANDVLAGLTVNSKPSTWTNNCDGGVGGSGMGTPPRVPAEGKPGAARITYLDYGPGGSGGGAGHIDALRTLGVTPGETLSVQVGRKGIGGAAGYINSSGSVISPTKGEPQSNSIPADMLSLISHSGTILQQTRAYSPKGGSPAGTSGYYYGSWEMAVAYFIYVNGVSAGRPSTDPQSGDWLSYDGRAAGDVMGSGWNILATPPTYANGTIGGRGGHIETPWFTCTSGSGGTSSSPNGGNGQGYGCGGGGGYGLGNGGDGSGGYARLEYNPSSIGSGGGGGAGYTANKIKISVTSRETIPYTIGAGGIGGKIINNTSTPAKDGGITTFNTGSKLIQAGGGYGGGNVSTSSNTIINGTAGNNASICTVAGTTSSICKFGSATPTPGSNSKGGNGGASLQGPGGQGGAPSDILTIARGTNTITQLGAGGSGAATYINPSISMPVPTYPQGGQGGHGVIIVEWK